MNARVWLFLALPAGALALPAACDSGQSPLTGIGEPVVISGGQFIPGNLPGAPPASDDSGAPTAEDAGEDAGPPTPLTVSDLGFATTSILAGAAGHSFTGDVTSDSIAVGVRLAGIGTGYWVVPVGAPDPIIPNHYTFSVSASFGVNDPPGLRDLLFVAIGPAGNAGVQQDIQLCLNSRIPNNGFSCYPTISSPPHAVFTLEWDQDFDLDLHVVTPDGIDFNPKTAPYGVDIDAGETRDLGSDQPGTGLPHIDRDSLRGCVPDGLRQEDFIYPDALPPGLYTIYVDPFAACGFAATHFKFSFYESSGTCPGATCRFGAATAPIYGEVTSADVTGGVGTKLKIDQLSVN